MLKVSIITSTHGARGEVKIFPATDNPERFNELKEIILDTGKEQIPLEIEQVKHFKSTVILEPKGHGNANDIEEYKSKNLFITRDHAVGLGPDEHLIVDLIRLQVLTEGGGTFGVLKDVLGADANGVHVVEMKNGRELLIPAIKDCILNVDTKQGTMTVHFLKGLMDL